MLVQKLRRKAGQDSGRIKENLQSKEIQKDIEKKKAGKYHLSQVHPSDDRIEKVAEAKARAAVKAQIEVSQRIAGGVRSSWP